jgi:hypothetical protein
MEQYAPCYVFNIMIRCRWQSAAIAGITKPCNTLGKVIRFLSILLLSASCAIAGDVIAVIKSPSMVYRLKGSNGAFLGQIQPSGGAISVGCDGETVAILNSHGVVSRYNAETGAFIGQNQPSGGPCTDVQVSGGVMLVRSPHLVRRYNARTGAFLGQSQF